MISGWGTFVLVSEEKLVSEERPNVSEERHVSVERPTVQMGPKIYLLGE